MNALYVALLVVGILASVFLPRFIDLQTALHNHIIQSQGLFSTTTTTLR